MHITTPITQSSSQLTNAHTVADKHIVLPKHLKKMLSHNQDETRELIPLSSQLTRLVDACGDCV